MHCLYSSFVAYHYLDHLSAPPSYSLLSGTLIYQQASDTTKKTYNHHLLSSKPLSIPLESTPSAPMSLQQHQAANMPERSSPHIQASHRLDLYHHELSPKLYISPLLADRGYHRATFSTRINGPLRSPVIAPVNTHLANTTEMPTRYAIPPPPPPAKRPDSIPPFPSSPLTASSEFPPCPISEPHLHGDHNPKRPYEYRNQHADQRQMRILRELGMADVWEGANPSPKVWDALFRTFLGE